MQEILIFSVSLLAGILLLIAFFEADKTTGLRATQIAIQNITNITNMPNITDVLDKLPVVPPPQVPPPQVKPPQVEPPQVKPPQVKPPNVLPPQLPFPRAKEPAELPISPPEQSSSGVLQPPAEPMHDHLREDLGGGFRKSVHEFDECSKKILYEHIEGSVVTYTIEFTCSDRKVTKTLTTTKGRCGCC